MPCCLVVVTFGSEENAQSVVDVLVGGQHVPCVQIYPITSQYRREGKVYCKTEWQCVIKTTCDVYKQVEGLVLEHHDYEVPEIIQLPIATGYGPYLAWIENKGVSGV